MISLSPSNFPLHWTRWNSLDIPFREKHPERRSLFLCLEADSWSRLSFLVTECLFTQLPGRRVRVLEHSSDGRTLTLWLYCQMSEERHGASDTSNTSQFQGDVGTEWNSTSINFFLRTPRGRFSHNARCSRRSLDFSKSSLSRSRFESMLGRDPWSQLMSQWQRANHWSQFCFKLCSYRNRYRSLVSRTSN